MTDIQTAVNACIKALYAVRVMSPLRSRQQDCWCDSSYDLRSYLQVHQAKCQAATNAIVAAERVAALLAALEGKSEQTTDQTFTRREEPAALDGQDLRARNKVRS